MTARWILPEPMTANGSTGRIVAELARTLGCSPSIARLLVCRGVTSVDCATRFLNPMLKTLSDPFLLPDMAPAVERILTAVDRRERIVLYGDYDVDGIASLALLSRLLGAYGASPQCFLPDRIEEGYGITTNGLARCVKEFQPRLLIALDCGTASAAEVATLTSSGVDVIVVDHHECQRTNANEHGAARTIEASETSLHSGLPACTAVVNPKRTDVPPPAADDFRYLCTAGLVFKLCHALLKTRPWADFALRDYLDLVALGTVADIVPLIRENRILVLKGLEAMERTRSCGLRALMEVAGIKTPLSPRDVAFQIAPRLNASGRLGTARDSLELLLTGDSVRARALAQSLDAQNNERRQVERDTLAAAEAQLGVVPADHRAIVCGGGEWHPGVLGIVASRLCKQYHRPTLVIGFDESGMGKGSGRGVEGMSLVEALGRCGSLLERFGGHEMAAGLTIRQERFAEFQQAFRQAVGALLSTANLLPSLHMDSELDLGEIDLEFLAEHERLQPFGMGNAHPVFVTRGVRPVGEPVVLKEKHLRLTLARNGSRHEAIFFNGATEPLPAPPWDVAFKIARNEWRERVTVQIQIQAIRTAE